MQFTESKDRLQHVPGHQREWSLLFIISYFDIKMAKSNTYAQEHHTYTQVDYSLVIFTTCLFFIVCDLPPNGQEQMPLEESGNMV